jgi:hypothetical protein
MTRETVDIEIPSEAASCFKFGLLCATGSGLGEGWGFAGGLGTHPACGQFPLPKRTKNHPFVVETAL